MLIVFDLDDTLIDTTASIMPSRLEKALERLIKGKTQLADHQEALKMLRRLDETALSAKSAFSEFLEINDIDQESAESAAMEIYSTNLNGVVILKRDDVDEVLEELSREHQLAIVSSGDEQMQIEKLKLAKIPEGLFSTIQICPTGGKELVYRTLIDEYKLDPKEILVCGDRIENDLLPAKRLGMTTIHMKSGRGMNSVDWKDVVDYEISGMKQLVEIAGQIDRRNYMRNA